MKDHDKKVKKVMEAIVQKYGERSIKTIDTCEQFPMGTTSSGIEALDQALGIGGFPQGRIIEIFGSPDSGKTSIALHAIVEAQRKGGWAVLVDVDQSFDEIYAQHLGINIEMLIIARPQSGEEALDIVELFVSSGTVDIVVIDSLAAIVPREELEGELTDAHQGLQERLIEKSLKRLIIYLNRHNIICIFVNQVREKIPSLSFYGNNEITCGGKALRYYATIRIDVRRISSGAIREEDAIVGWRIAIKVVKNKVSPPYKTAKVSLIFGKGFVA